MSKSSNSTFSYQGFDSGFIQSITRLREGETKIGEVVSTKCSESTKVAILGICEDVGPQANLGRPGSDQAFRAFLSTFLNMQSNSFCSGAEIAMVGQIKVDSSRSDTDSRRSAVAELDDFVVETLNTLDLGDDTLLITIGGGHNNAYPLMKYFGSQANLHVLNIDPHADTRPLEGRHSGNPFSAAMNDGFLSSYHLLGLHESYNSSGIYQFLQENGCAYRTFEAYLDQPALFLEDVTSIGASLKGKDCALEIDLDAIAGMPSSAFTPSGFTVNEIRSAIRLFTRTVRPKYIHLPEGAPQSDDEKRIVGKSLAYFVMDAIKCIEN